LSPKKGLLHPKFKAVEIVDDYNYDTIETRKIDNLNKEQVIHIDHESFYDGRLFGELKSRATVHLEVHNIYHTWAWVNFMGGG
jgi:hypothetical protein